MYAIREAFIAKNRSGRVLVPQGITIHATATPGATAQREFEYFNREQINASAHFFVDWTEIVNTVPVNEQAWHARTIPNRRYIGIEMCEPSKERNDLKFNEVLLRTLWLTSHLMKQFNLGIETVNSHAQCTKLYGGSHTDPIDYLKLYGMTWENFIQRLKEYK